MRALTRDLSRRSIVLLAALLAVLLALPLVANDYQITVLVLILYLAYVGQAWNIMMGFAGLLSLGHALYVGLAAYLSGLLFKDYGISPWLGLLAAIPLSASAGAMISFLAFRFRVTGVYFAILTIAFAEFARIGFDHLAIVNGSGGLFLPVAQNPRSDLWLLRGPPTMFYYVILAATVVAALLSRALLGSRIGYFWLAIREDEQAARATGIDTFRYKTAAVVISAASRPSPASSTPSTTTTSFPSRSSTSPARSSSSSDRSSAVSGRSSDRWWAPSFSPACRSS